MKEITIPNDMSPFVVIINEQRYTYTPGETVSVPDEVYEIIKQQVEAAPVYDTTVKLETVEYKPEDTGKMLRVADDGTGLAWEDMPKIPTPSAANVGKILEVQQVATNPGAVIIPEQEPAFGSYDYADLEIEDAEKFWAQFDIGDKVLIRGTFESNDEDATVINFETVQEVVENGGDRYCYFNVKLSEQYSLGCTINTSQIGYTEKPTLTMETASSGFIKTIAVFAAEPVYKWVEGEKPAGPRVAPRINMKHTHEHSGTEFYGIFSVVRDFGEEGLKSIIIQDAILNNMWSECEVLVPGEPIIDYAIYIPPTVMGLRKDEYVFWNPGTIGGDFTIEGEYKSAIVLIGSVSVEGYVFTGNEISITIDND